MTKAEYFKLFEGNTSFSAEALELLFPLLDDGEPIEVADVCKAYAEASTEDLAGEHDIDVYYEDETGWNRNVNGMVYEFMESYTDIVGVTDGGDKIVFLK